jgi:hypothetical protein
MHGGASTGPRTPEGLERSRRACWIHGRYSQAALEARRQANWETTDAAKRRFEREIRRINRRSDREVRRMTRAMDLLLKY